MIETTERKIDYAGVAILTGGVVAILLALDEGTTQGFTDPLILGLFAVGAVLLTTFFLVERRQGEGALVPNDVLSNRVFAAACATVLTISAIFFSALLYLPQFMNHELDFSALGSGAGLLPMMAVFGITSFVAGSLYARLGARLIVSLGAGLLGIGMFLLSLIGPGSSYVALVPGMIVLGIGVGLFYSSITTCAVTALDPSRSSLAGGIVYMCQIAGGAIGLGINTAIVTSAPVFADGISNAFLFDAILALIGLTIAVRFIAGTEHTHRHRDFRWHRAHA